MGAVALALASIDAPRARSQGATPLDAATPAISPISDDDEEGDDVATGPAAAALPDPADPDARDAWLDDRLTAILGGFPQLGAARVGVSVVDLTTGQALFGSRADLGLNLASNTKVLTSAAALARLGPDFRWRTALYADKWNPETAEIEGDLYIRGRGDPTLKSSELRTLIHDLHMAGVRTIRGGIVFDGSYFDGVTEPPYFDDQPKERAGFRAPYGAFNLDQNAVVVVIEPDPAGVDFARVWLEPDVAPYVVLKYDEVMTVPTGRTRLHVETTIKKDKDKTVELEVTGQIRPESPEWIRRRIDDPVKFTGEILQRALAAEGIKLGKKKLGKDTVPPRARELAVHDSAPLGEIVRQMNKISNNFYAEALLKTLGAEAIAGVGAPRPATWADGVAEVARYLTEVVGLDPGSFRAGNGSGLFGASQVSAAQLTKVLDAAWRDFRVGPDLAASLAIMGVDGTVRSRLRATPVRGRARVKTGTLASVSSLAGYVAVDSRRVLAFAVIVNDIPDASRGWARALQNQIVEACVGYLGGT